MTDMQNKPKDTKAPFVKAVDTTMPKVVASSAGAVQKGTTNVKSKSK